MNRLNEKVIIITGGNGLIGKSLINEVRSQNAICINADLHSKTTEDLSNIICDVTNVNSIENTINLVIEKYGKIDGLVNNAYPRTNDWGNKFENILFESWRKNVDMHLNGYFLCCQVVLNQMKKLLQQYQEYQRSLNKVLFFHIILRLNSILIK